MRLQRQAERAVIVDDMLAERHDRQAGFRLLSRDGSFGPVEQRQPLGSTCAVQRAHSPERGATVETQRTEGVSFGETLDLGDIEAGTQPDIAHRVVAVAAALDESFHIGLPKGP